MKKIFVLFTFMSFVSFAVNAQTCPYAKKNASSASTEVSSDYAHTVAAAAEMDETIEKRVCEKSGNVSYERKNVCSTSGKVSYTSVQFDASTKKFVNVSPSDAKASGKKACCTAGAAKTSGKKAGCCAGGNAKACTKSKSTSTSAASGAKVKMVKSEQ